MKKILAVLGIALLVAVFAYPAFSRGPGWDWGHHVMGFWDRDYQYGSMHERGHEGLSDRKRVEMEALDRKYDEETEGINRFERGYGRGSSRDHWGRGGGRAYGPGSCWR